MLCANKLHSLSLVVVLVLFAAGLISSRQMAKRGAATEVAGLHNASFTLPKTSSMSNSVETQEQAQFNVRTGYGNLPLSFEPNRGQTDPRVKFLSRAGNRTLWLTSDEAVLAVGRPPRPMGPDMKQAAAPKENQIAPAVLRMKFIGANAGPVIEGEAKQPGIINYFTGKPDEWRTKIPTYARVRYRSLYPGIDLVFYGNNRELEYDLVVAPGADPGQIKLGISGAENLRLDGEGNLLLQTTAGEVIQQKPRIYQRKGAALKPVSGEYVLTAKDKVGFRLGSYDRQTAVVIDPVLRYSTFLGGNQIDEASTIAVDSSRRAVIGGFTDSPNFPTTTGNPSSGPQAFIAKFDSTGSRLVFSAFLSHVDGFPRLALDAGDNIYVAGSTSSDQFPTTPGAFQRTLAGGIDAFVAKLNPNGTALIYSTLLGGAGQDEGLSVAVDPAGNAYVTGLTESLNFPVTRGVFQPECKLNTFLNACINVFVTKLNANGSRALYSTYLGGHGSQNASGIAVNRDGHAFVVGLTNATDFPTTAGSAQPVAPGSQDGFVTKISSSGSYLEYSTYLGGTSPDFASGIELDSLGNAFVTGGTASTDFPVKNAFQPKGGFGVSPFVTKLSSRGTILYSTYLGGSLTGEQGMGIAATPDGQAYVTGTANSQQFPTTQNAFQRVFGGVTDIFLAKFSPAGKLVYSSYLGGSGNDFPNAVALDRDANAYVTGIADFQNPVDVSNFPVTPGAFQQKFGGGGGDAFVAKVVSLCALSTMNRSVTICSPANGSSVKSLVKIVRSPVNIVAGTTDATPVKLTQVYLDDKKIYEAPLSAIDVNLPVSRGRHRLTVQALDTDNVFFKKTVCVMVIH